MPSPKVALPPGGSPARLVFRQNRDLPSGSATVMEVIGPGALTVKIVPLSAFSGRPPSAGGLNRGARQVPVQSADGSIFALAWVSLSLTSVRYGVLAPSMLASQRVFQKISLPLQNAR